MKAKRTFKDSLFRYMFNNKKRLADLYEALTGRKISPRASKIPPAVSAKAAMNPQNTRAKSIPTSLIVPPMLVHVSTPPIILGNP